MKKKKTIILLAPKRCGTTAIFNVFKKHSKVKVAHHDQQIENWEPQFWNLSLDAINGNSRELISRMKKTFPKVKFYKPFNKKKIFLLWNSILEEYGPCIFDKSPQYIYNYKTLNLIYEFKKKGNDVRFISLLRNPRDAITSQHELWKEYTGEYNLKKREKNWLKYISNIEKFRSKVKFPLFRYEDIAMNKNIYFKKLFKSCDLKFEKETLNDFKPVSINRYDMALNKQVKNWKGSRKFKIHLKKYNYEVEKKKFTKNEKIIFFLKNIKRFVPLKYKNFIKLGFK